MKKLLLTLLAAVLVSGAMAQDTAFPDIPANHWAADAVSRIADLGIVIGFPDGTFRGNEAFTRYQAALVISRMLDVVNNNVNSALAMTQADIESLRNAVQEVASDVASQGVRLSSAESAIASLSDDVTANKSRLDELESKLNNMPQGTDQSVLRDLQNQIASQRVAIDTAQAQADAAAKRANEAYDLANQAKSQAEQNAADIAAANKVIQLLSDKLQGMSGQAAPAAPAQDLSGIQGDIARNASDIANIREFVILLRRDQVALRDRVSALEASDAQQTADIQDLQGRVTALEENPLGLSGSIELEYFVGRTLGLPFDIDRAYGLNNERDMGSSVFSSGAEDLNDDDEGTDDYQTEVSEVAQDREDITAQSGAVDVTLNLNIGLGTELNGAGSTGALNNFSAVITLSLAQVNGLNWDNQDDYAGDPGYVFHVDDFTTTFEPVGAAPLTFQFGTAVDATFTSYVLDTTNLANDLAGFAATMASPDFLSFINPSITVVYGSPDMNEYIRGARLTLNPLDGVTIGGSYVQDAANAGEKDNVANDNVTTTVYGVDGNVSVSLFNLAAEWASGSTYNDATATTTADGQVLYATLGVDGSSLPILNSLELNYRDIAPNWTSAGFNVGADDGDYPYAEDQSGFGVNADLSLFILDLSAYFDSFSITNPAALDIQAYGADLTANLFAGFSLSGYYHSVSVGGALVDDLEDPFLADETAAPGTGGADISRDNNYDTAFGVTLKHDGSADNALIHGLNLEASYSQSEADFSKTTIDAMGDFALNVSIISLTPYAEYKSVNDADPLSDDTTTLKAGAGLTTAPVDVFLKPSLMGAVNYRNTDHTDVAGGDYTASELQWSVGLVLNQFLFDHSTLTAKYGSWNGTNIQTRTNVNLGQNDHASDISDGDVNNGDFQQTTTGYEVIWNYYDLELAYGVYENTSRTFGSDSAQAFKISYTVDF